MLIAQVILDIPTQALDEPYSYRVPDDREDGLAVEVGCAVVVPFGRRRVVGFVVEIADLGADELPGGLDPGKLKYIVRSVSSPYFDENGAACAQWLSKRYIAPLSTCVRMFTPPGGVARMVRSREGSWRLEQPKIGRVDDRWVTLGEAAASFEPRANAVKQKQIIEALSKGDLRAAELSVEFGNVSATLKSLAAKDVVRIERRRRARSVPAQAFEETVERTRPNRAEAGNPAYAHVFVPSASPSLTEGQRNAIEEIERARALGDGRVVLVDGVTGSGKTEVYLKAIESALRDGRTACVLVPEISLTPQTVARFRGRFGDQVAVMHSRMSDGERYDQWDFIRSGAARVVVGARSALFTPLADIGIIVIDEEHETSSYKQDGAPRYHAREVAVWMARRSGAVVVLGSATPSIETLYAVAKDGRWTQARLPERANGRPLPPVEVIDMAREFSSGSRSMFSQCLLQALEDELSAGRKAVLLLNQRGFAKFVLCRDCGFVPTCPSCSTSLTYHERGNVLVCHHCGYRLGAMATCPECGSRYLRKFGAGTQRVEDELCALVRGFKGAAHDAPIIRMDADTTSTKGAHQRLLDQFAAADAAVLLGTQMIAKGLDFDDVTLVGVINADTQLNLPDYRAAERTFDLIEQVAGRAGRADLAGRVMVQTYQADAVAIRAAAAYDRAAFLRDELPKRRALGYPPYVELANVLVWGPDEDVVAQAAASWRKSIAERVRECDGRGWNVLAASPCVMSKLKGSFRWHILIKAPLGSDVAAMLLPLFRAHKASAAYNIAVDIDPVSLL